MRVRQGELQALSSALVTALVKQGFVHPRRTETALGERIVELLAHNLEQEAALEEEAERLAAAHARQMSGMDQRKIINGIKERLARERGFTL